MYFFDWVDPSKTPRERVYQLYYEKHTLWRQNQQLNARINAMDKSNLKLERANLLLEIDLKIEQHLKLVSIGVFVSVTWWSVYLLWT